MLFRSPGLLDDFRVEHDHISAFIVKDDDALVFYLEEGAHAYAHLLGFRKDSEKVISAVAKQSRIPLLTKLYDTDFLSDTGRRMLTQDILASNLYNSVVTDKYKTAYENEYHQAIIKV